MKNFCWENSLKTFVWLAVWLGWAGSEVLAGIEPDFLMDSDPELRIPKPVENFNPAMAALWIAALERPDADMQRLAAETIVRAHEYGIPDLHKAVPDLERILVSDLSHPAARFAAARAIIALGSHGSEQKLFEASQSSGADLQQLVEPALAARGNAAMKSVWLERIKTADTRPRDLSLAIEGLGTVREQSALEDLLSIVRDVSRSPAVRLAAAAAAGNIAESGMETDADRLARITRSPLFVNQLCAIRLLARHSSENARQTLIELAGHEEPAVAAAALQRLNGIDFSLVLPMAESAMKSPDPRIRRQGAASVMNRPGPSLIPPLSQLLADPNPGVRRDVCEGLFQLAEQPELNEPIRAAAQQVLAGESWEGQEQAAMLLGALEHKPAADRLVELLESPRAEVDIATAWALRKVAVPETIPALIDRAKRRTEQRRVQGDSPELDEEVAHLFEALGVLHAADATPLLLEYVPKRAGWHHSRGAAIWAIGYLNTGTRDPELEAKLNDRIMDFEPQPSESSLVKQMSSIALGRMRAVDHASMLKQYAESDDVEISLQLALGWAVRELTGEILPPPNPATVSQGDWFLQPLP